MSHLFELIPLVGFFIVYKMYDIYMGVLALMILMACSLLSYKLQKKTITSMQWVSFILVLIFGGITLFFRNEIFIKWKPTVLNWGFGLAFLISQYVGSKNFTERLLSAAKIEAPKKIWNRLNMSWVIFFMASGALNIIIAYSFSTDVWVNFKIFGLFGLTLLFAVAQAFYLKNHLKN
ncbi:MAG TPA: inner membrane-spanning protein YciB [Myxococcota bacterium]|nr:inner membrane-spanning protein YciB [Myxococcota bacterium]